MSGICIKLKNKEYNFENEIDAKLFIYLFNKFENKYSNEVNLKKVSSNSEIEINKIIKALINTEVNLDKKNEKDQEEKQVTNFRMEAELPDNFDDEDDVPFRKSNELEKEDINAEEMVWLVNTFGKANAELFKKRWSVLKKEANGPYWGKWTTSSVYVYKGAKKGTIYHEAWHEFSQLILTKEEKFKLYSLVRDSIPKLKNASFLEIEEFLADDFMDYKLNNGKSVLSKKSKYAESLFKKLLNWLKALFGKPTNQTLESNLELLYNKLNKGEFVYSENNNYLNFGELHRLKDFKEFNNLNIVNIQGIESTELAIETHLTALSSILLKDENLKDLNVIFNDGLITLPDGTIESFLIYFEKKLKNSQEIYYNEIKNKTKNNDALELHEFITNNFSKFFKEFSKTSFLKDINSNNKYFFDDNDNLIEYSINDEIDGNSNRDLAWSLNGNEIDAMEKASKYTKFLLSTLPEIDEKTNTYLINKTFSTLNVVNYTNIFRKLQSSLQGILNADEMLEKIEFLSKDDLSIKLFFDRLPKETLSDAIVLARVFNDLNLTRVPIDKALVDENNVTTVIEDQKDSYSKFIGDAITRMNNKVGIYSFIEVLPREVKLENNKIIPANSTVINIQKLNAFIEKLNINDPSKNNILSLKALYDGIGFEFSKSALNKMALINGIDPITNIPNYLIETVYRNISLFTRLKTFVNERSKNNSEKYNYVISFIEEMENPSLPRLDSERSFIKTLIDKEIKFGDTYITGQSKTADNKPIYEYTLNNYITILKNTINNTKLYPTYQDLIADEAWQHLDKNRNPLLMVNSKLEALFYLDPNHAKYGQRKLDSNGDPVKLQVSNISGISFVSDEEVFLEGSTTLNTDMLSKFMIDFIGLLKHGKIENARFADKSSAFIEYVNEGYKNGSKTIIPLVNFINSNNSNNFLISYFERILKQEIGMAFYAYAVDLSNFKEKTVLKIQNFNLLKNYLSENEINHIKDLINNELKNTKDLNKIIENPNDLSLLFNNFYNKEINNSFIKDLFLNNYESYLTNREKRLKSTLMKMYGFTAEELYNTITGYEETKVLNVFSKLKNGDFLNFDEKELDIDYLPKGIDRNIDKNLKNESAFSKLSLDELLKAFIYNQTLEYIDNFSLIFGHPSMYKDLSDIYKRLPAYNTTGNLPDTSNFINEKLNRDSNRYLEFETLFPKQTPKFRKNNQVRSYVFEDFNTTSETFNNILKNAKKDVDDLYEVMSMYTNKDYTEPDAQAYSTLQFYRELSIRLGRWDMNKQEKTYIKIIKGENINLKEIGLFPPLKLGFTGAILNDYFHFPAYHKFSVKPIIIFNDNILNNTNLKKVRNFMLQNNLDYITFESGSKAVNKVTKPIYKDNNKRILNIDNLKLNNSEVVTSFFNFYKEQLEIHAEEKDKNIFGTQFRKLLFADKFDNGVPIDFEKDNTIKNSKVNQWKSLTEERKKAKSFIYEQYVNYLNILDNLFIEEAKKLSKEAGFVFSFANNRFESLEVKNLELFYQLLEKEINSRNLSPNILNIFELSEDKKTFAKEIEFSNYKILIENVILSIINNRLVRLKINGESLIQVASTLFEAPVNQEYNNKLEKLNNKFKVSKINKIKDNKLKEVQNLLNKPITNFYTLEDGSVSKIREMEVAVSFSSNYTSLFELTDLEGNKIKVFKNKEIDLQASLNKLNELMLNKEWYELHKKSFLMIGYRIPTQSLNSIEVMSIKQFLHPANGSIIVLPSEIVVKSGSDFDIDKLNVIRPFLLNGEFISQEIIDKNSEEYNKKLELLEELKNELTSLEETIEEINNDLKNANEEEIVNLEKELKNVTSVYQKTKFKISKTSNFIKKLKNNINKSNITINTNKILDIAKNIALHEKTLNRLLKPNDTEILQKDQANEIRKITDGKIISKYPIDKDNISEVYSFESSENSRNAFAIGKRVLGVAALKQAITVLEQINGLYLMNEYKVDLLEEFHETKNPFIKTIMKFNHNVQIVNNETYIDYSSKFFKNPYEINYKNENNEQITKVVSQLEKSEIFSQYINAYVDVAKDPFILSMNAIMETAPIAFHLMSAGVDPKTAAYFINQPIIYELLQNITKYENNMTKFNRVISNKNSFTYFTAIKLIEKYFEKEAYDLKILPAISVFNNNIIVNSSKFLLETQNFLQEANFELFTKEELNKNLNTTSNDISQLYYLIQFIHSMKQAESMRTISSNITFDTSKTASVIHAKKWESNLNILSSFDTIIPARKFIELKDKSIVSPFHVQGIIIDISKKLLKLQNIPVVENLFNNILNEPSIKFSMKKLEILSNKLSSDLQSFVLQNMLVEGNDNYVFKRSVDEEGITFYDKYIHLVKNVEKNGKANDETIKDKYDRLYNKYKSDNSTFKIFDDESLKKRFYIINNIKFITDKMGIIQIMHNNNKPDNKNLEIIKAEWARNMNYRAIIEEAARNGQKITPAQQQFAIDMEEFYTDLFRATLLAQGTGLGRQTLNHFLPDNEWNKLIQPAAFEFRTLLENNIRTDIPIINFFLSGRIKEDGKIDYNKDVFSNRVLSNNRVKLSMGKQFKTVDKKSSTYYKDYTISSEYKMDININFEKEIQTENNEFISSSDFKIFNSKINNIGFKLSIDKKGKDQGKADLSNHFIGYGIVNTSTYQYEQDARKFGIPVNYEGVIDENTIAFVSVNGNNKASEEAIFNTIENAREVLEKGGTIIMDSTFDANRGWNKSGEALVQEQLGTPTGQTSKGYNYWGKNPELFNKTKSLTDLTLNSEFISEFKLIRESLKQENPEKIITNQEVLSKMEELGLLEKFCKI